MINYEAQNSVNLYKKIIGFLIRLGSEVEFGIARLPISVYDCELSESQFISVILKFAHYTININ